MINFYWKQGDALYNDQLLLETRRRFVQRSTFIGNKETLCTTQLKACYPCFLKRYRQGTNQFYHSANNHFNNEQR
jgi:hypothetical protein